jgi:6-phospho-beta-glucosidase
MGLRTHAIASGVVMKVAVIGGGSTYTPELVNGFLDRLDTFPLTELWLMDVDAGRLKVVGEFARRMLAARGAPFQVVLTQDQRAAVQAASYVTTQIRVGQMAARRADEYLGHRHGLIGQETTGVGGMAKALRTIPVILKLAGDIRELAPQALLVNFTNPSGLITQALARHAPEVLSVGVCNGPFQTRMTILRSLEERLGEPISPPRGELKTLGLNHLSWHRGFLLDGEDVWPQVMDGYLKMLRSQPDPAWDVATIEALGMIPNGYLEYYYSTRRKLEEQSRWPPSRAEEVMVIEESLLRQYADPALVQPPAELMNRGGAYYSTVATQVLNAHYNDLGETQIVNTVQGGAVPGWPPDWVLELPCRVDRAGIHPLPTEPLPAGCFDLLARVKAYELLTVEAAVHGDRRAAYQALLAHPLGPPAEGVQALLDDLLETHRLHLPQFWQG